MTEMTSWEFVERELELTRQMFLRQHVIQPMVMFIFIELNQRMAVVAEFHSQPHKEIISQGIKDLVKRVDPDIVVYSAEGQIDEVDVVVVRAEFKTGEKYECTAKVLRRGRLRLDEFEVKSGGVSMGSFADFYPITKDKLS